MSTLENILPKKTSELLKGLSHEMDVYGYFLGLNRGRDNFLIFLCSNDFYNAKSVFLAVNESLRPGFLASFWSSGCETFLQVSALASWRGLCKFYVIAGGKRPIQRQPPLVRFKKQANPLLSMNNYTPLVSSWNDKNNQLTLLSHRKLALAARNTLTLFAF